MNWKVSRRLLRRFGLALAIAAFAAPAAQATPMITDQSAGVPESQVLVASAPTDSLGRPLPRSEPIDSLGRPLGAGMPQPSSDVVSDSSAFDWTHVGIGFFAIGLLLLVGGALILGRQNRRSRLAAT